jgi:2-methylisocitrate lyase-like PEP mutase family enzyme
MAAAILLCTIGEEHERYTDASMAHDFASRRAAFRQLHEGGCFVMPNPWDVGTARYLQHLGFRALATTSSGFAFSHGRSDGEAFADRGGTLAHIAGIVGATDLPVNADFQSAFGRDPEHVAESVALCIATGVAGLSIEDATGDPSKPLHELGRAVERVAAARAAVDVSATGVVLTARAECHLVDHPTALAESIRRLRAYAEAGADVLYAPGPRDPAHIREIVAAVAPKPVNVLMSAHTGLTLADLAALGVRRVSVGSSLSRAAWTAFIRAAKAMAEGGRFEGLDALVPFSELDGFFKT